MNRGTNFALLLVVLCQIIALSQGWAFKFPLGRSSIWSKPLLGVSNIDRPAVQRVSTVLQANPRRMDVGEGQAAFSSELVKHELLTIDDEMELARQYKIGMQILAQTKQLQSKFEREVTIEDVAASLEIDGEQLLNLLRKMETAKKLLVKANMRLVFHIARYYKNRGVTYPDLVQEGTFGLIKSIDKYDPSKGFRFSTYASWWIKQAVSRCIAEKSRLVRLPVHIHDMMVSIARVEKQFITAYSRKPSAQEIAERLALPLQKVELLLKNTLDVNSIDENAFQNRGKVVNNEVQVKDRLASDSVREPSAMSVGSSLREELRRALSGLTDREAQVLILRFGLNGDTPYTLEDIGQKFSVTRERIRQIEARALSKMRHPAKKSELQEIFQERAVFAAFPSSTTTSTTSAASSTAATSSAYAASAGAHPHYLSDDAIVSTEQVPPVSAVSGINSRFLSPTAAVVVPAREARDMESNIVDMGLLESDSEVHYMPSKALESVGPAKVYSYSK